MKSNWQTKKLGEICKTSSGGTPSRKKKIFYEGKIPWAKSGELNFNTIRNTEERISDEAIMESSAKLFSTGTLLIALYGATVGKSIGGAQPNISQTILKDVDVPVSPLPTQNRIVEKIEELFSELDEEKHQHSKIIYFIPIVGRWPVFIFLIFL